MGTGASLLAYLRQTQISSDQMHPKFGILFCKSLFANLYMKHKCFESIDFYIKPIPNRCFVVFLLHNSLLYQWIVCFRIMVTN